MGKSRRDGKAQKKTYGKSMGLFLCRSKGVGQQKREGMGMVETRLGGRNIHRSINKNLSNLGTKKGGGKKVGKGEVGGSVRKVCTKLKIKKKI